MINKNYNKNTIPLLFPTQKTSLVLISAKEESCQHISQKKTGHVLQDIY